VRASRFFYGPTANANFKEIGAMGSPVGVYTDKEVKALKPKDRALLKEHAIQQLRNSEEIHRIIMTDKQLLPQLLKTHPKVRNVLRKKMRPMLNRLRKK
jgi:hypothetical protein